MCNRTFLVDFKVKFKSECIDPIKLQQLWFGLKNYAAKEIEKARERNIPRHVTDFSLIVLVSLIPKSSFGEIYLG